MEKCLISSKKMSFETPGKCIKKYLIYENIYTLIHAGLHFIVKLNNSFHDYMSKSRKQG